MNILFDHGTPVPLRHHLTEHTVQTAYELGWSNLENGALIASAEDSFDLLITPDQQLRYQQNLVARKLSVLVLMTTTLAANSGTCFRNCPNNQTNQGSVNIERSTSIDERFALASFMSR
jgi:hypothetical protein